MASQKCFAFNCCLIAAILVLIMNPWHQEPITDNHPTLDKYQAPLNRERAFNKFPTEYDEHMNKEFRRLVQMKASASDPDLVRLVRDMVDRPNPGHMTKLSDKEKALKTPQADYVNSFLNKKDGFFVECGAFDGSISSNSIYLEHHRGWTGLLVEMDPFLYTQLKGKNRRVSSVNACLSPRTYPTQLQFSEHQGQLGKLLSKASTNSPSAPCIPFETLMLALNQKHVDYFSLDVEGNELDVLQTIPFDRINIDVFSVEYSHVRQGKDALVDFMRQKGYTKQKTIHYGNAQERVYVDDFIFVKDHLANNKTV